MTEATPVAPALLDDYRARLTSAGYDELLTPLGARAPSEELASRINHVGLAGLMDRRVRATRFVQDDGVTYGGTPAGAAGDAPVARGWRLDPLPLMISATDWADLERGLVQRAELLDLVLADIYGERQLVRRGVIPPEVIFGHGGFVHQADGIRAPGKRQLFFTATDLARNADGRWNVLSDRTQAPSGAGYAMENRRVVAKVFPGLRRTTDLSTLRDFFHVVRLALHEVAPEHAEAPRIVLLTPGPESETAFDQAYLSTLLGFPLAEADDLVVRKGQVFLRNLDRLEVVDVLLRRVDADYSDPLEMRPDSQLGVPGLLEASRRGAVTVVNTFGTGVLENPGLLPYLSAAAQALIGDDLLLPSVQTWWCGDPVQRQHVLANLDHLVIKPITRGLRISSRFGTELTSDQTDLLRRKIEAEPWAWTAQEVVEKSTAPVVTPLGLEPRDLVLRTFGVAHAGSYTVMRGGLARVAAGTGTQVVSNLTGALTKDVWVLSGDSTAADTWSEGDHADPTVIEVAMTSGLSPRVAEDLFWLGRYAERAEGTARLLRVADDLAEDFARRPGTLGHASLGVLMAAIGGLVGFSSDDSVDVILRRLTTDRTQPGSVLHAATRTITLAQSLREQLSMDTWLVLGRLERSFSDSAAAGEADLADVPLQPVLAQTVESLLAFAGLGAESLVRDEGWHFLEAGRRLERAQHLVGLLRHTLNRPIAPRVLPRVLEAVLIAGESVITHRRREAARPTHLSPIGSVLDLLLCDATNPRSLAFQFDRLATALDGVPQAADSPLIAASVGGLRDRLAQAPFEALGDHGDRTPYDEWMASTERELRSLSSLLARAHFVHKAPQQVMPAFWGLSEPVGSR